MSAQSIDLSDRPAGSGDRRAAGPAARAVSADVATAAEAASVLAEWALAAVADVLAGRPVAQPGPRGSASLRPLLRPARLGGLRARRAERALDRPLRHAAGLPAYTDLQRVAGDRIVPPGRLSRALRRLAGPAAPARHVPEALPELAGLMAWDDPAFRHAVAGLLRDDLRGRVLFAPGDLPAPVPSPGTFWLLLAAARVRRRAWPFPATALALRERAAGLALAPGWAGFWDQWLLGEWLARRPRRARRLPEPLGAAVAALPLMQAPRYARPAARAAPAVGFRRDRAPQLARPDWHESMPPWMPLDPVRTGSG